MRRPAPAWYNLERACKHTIDPPARQRLLPPASISGPAKQNQKVLSFKSGIEIHGTTLAENEPTAMR
jgi:hypothetical protein